jgi:hypothetical protein
VTQCQEPRSRRRRRTIATILQDLPCVRPKERSKSLSRIPAFRMCLACQQLDHRMFNRAARARSWVALAVRMNGQQHGMMAPAPSAVKHPGANVCQRAKHVRPSKAGIQLLALLPSVRRRLQYLECGQVHKYIDAHDSLDRSHVKHANRIGRHRVFQVISSRHGCRDHGAGDPLEG